MATDLFRLLSNHTFSFGFGNKPHTPVHLAQQLIEEGNELAKEKNFAKAISSFKDALRIIDFCDKFKDPKSTCGRPMEHKFSAKEVSDVVTPALYGLAVSNFHLAEHDKTIYYCKKLLDIQPRAQQAKDLLHRTSNSVKMVEDSKKN